MEHSSRISTLHLVPDWLKRLLEECHEEAKQQRKFPIKLIKGESRIAVWNLCAHLGFRSHGLPGQACRLLERYLSLRIHRDYASLDQEDWEEYKASMMAKVPLLITTCCVLAAKMHCAGAKVNGNVIRAKLLCKGLSFTVEEINETEFAVYSTIGFRIPLWTSVEAALLLALEVGVPTEKLDTVAATVNFADLKRDFIEEKVFYVVNLSPLANKTSCVRALHLSAGAVVAAGRVIHLPGPDLSTRLSDITRAPLPYINCIGDLICNVLLENNEDQPKRPSKRKMPL